MQFPEVIRNVYNIQRQQISISVFGSNPELTALEGAMLNITLQMGFVT
jgi:hypothetical protein